MTGIRARTKQAGNTKNTDDVVKKCWQIRMFSDKPLQIQKFLIGVDINMLNAHLPLVHHRIKIILRINESAVY